MNRLFKTIIIPIAAILLVVVMMFNIASWAGNYPNDIFKNGLDNVYRSYMFDIYPSTMSYQFWAIVYIYQLAWISYSISLFFRNTNTGVSYLFDEPNFLPVWIYVSFCVALVFNLIWIFVLDQNMAVTSALVMTLVVLALFVSLGFSLSSLNKHGPELLRLSHRLEVRLVRGLVQNGLATYLTWSAVVASVNFAMVAVGKLGLSGVDASTLTLGILAFFLNVYFILDLVIIDSYTRYLVAPYLVLLCAFGGMVSLSMLTRARNLYISLTATCFDLFCLITKSLIVVWKRGKDPIQIARK